MTDGPRAVIRLDSLTANLRRLKTHAPSHRVMAAVKANAYGHGLLDVARALGDVDALAVARLSEAQALRDGGVRTPIVVLAGAATAAELERAAALQTAPVMHSEALVAHFENSRQTFERVWLKVDTGMHRLGVAPAAVGALTQRLSATGRVGAVGLMTHMANADDPEDPMTAAQLGRFADVARDYSGDISICNSALTLSASGGSALDGISWRHAGDTWMRPGIGLYGISPFPERTAADLGLRPVMHLEADLIDVKPIAAGDPVGYGGIWRAPTDTLLGIVAAGYGDGYPRHVGSDAQVLINGRLVPIVGRVSMDLLALDLGPDAKAQAGDVAVLWGDGLPVEDVARWAHTIPYTLVTGVTGRVTRRAVASSV